MNTFYILSLIIWQPIICGAAMLLTARSKLWLGNLRSLALFASFLSLVLVLVMYNIFPKYTGNMQLIERLDWLPRIGVQYALGVDGISILLVALTVFMTFLVIIAGLTQVSKEIYIKYCATFLIMQGLMCGVFLAMDAVLFYMFFEAMMIPMFLIIGIWGGPNRIYATLKFILYTFLGSLLLLVAILYLHQVAHLSGFVVWDRFSIQIFQALPLSLTEQKWLFWAFLLAFAIKIPMWPVHTWLPDAHVEAPTGGSMILAAITLKIGGYGMLRFLMPIVPEGCAYFSTLMIVLSLIAIVYIGLVSIVQQDLKKLIAYSSIAHMGFVTLGLFIAFKVCRLTNGVPIAAMGIDGAMLQMISHGFISGALFLCVGVLYVRMHTRDISAFGGVVNTMPLFATYFMLFALANVGMPGTFGFVGEFFVILASFKASVWYAFFASCALILTVAYTLWMYKRVMFGVVVQQGIATLEDLTLNEKVAFGLLAIVTILFGVWPEPLLKIVQPSAQHLVTQLFK